jgi:hypothetical protein
MADPYGDVFYVYVRITDVITDVLSVGETVGPILSSPISPSSSLSQLSPSANNQPPLHPQKKSSSYQHNKLYFLKFCGHSIRVLIYRRILSIFVSNSIFLNFNI